MFGMGVVFGVRDKIWPSVPTLWTCFLRDGVDFELRTTSDGENTLVAWCGYGCSSLKQDID